MSGMKLHFGRVTSGSRIRRTDPAGQECAAKAPVASLCSQRCMVVLCATPSAAHCCPLPGRARTQPYAAAA